MYTWGYIKDASLAKLDLEQEEAVELGLLNRFTFYANEVITQICSSIKPKRSFYEIIVNKDNLGKLITMPKDFISFSDDISTLTVTDYGTLITSEVSDLELIYKGYNQIQCLREGIYHIAYNARWIKFDENTSENQELDVPADILDCIPSYIAHQCYKIDDEYKSSVYRNEYEMFLSRIDNTDFKNTGTIKITGDW